MPSSSSSSSSSSERVRVLFLISDTGGGHRASAEALSAAFDALFPGVVDARIVDFWTEIVGRPFEHFPEGYSFLAKNPPLWRAAWNYGRFPLTRRLTEEFANAVGHRNFRRELQTFQPNLIVSVHPLTQFIPLRVLNSRDDGLPSGTPRPPFVTVCTDLGGAHPTWFHPAVDLCFVPTDRVRSIALRCGLKPPQLRQLGLPVRQAFWASPPSSPSTPSSSPSSSPSTAAAAATTTMSSSTATTSVNPAASVTDHDHISTSAASATDSDSDSDPDDTSATTTLNADATPDADANAGVDAKSVARRRLRLRAAAVDASAPVVLIVGGGDGVGGIGRIASSVAERLSSSSSSSSCSATVVVVCGKNERLRGQLAGREWPAGVDVVVQGFVHNMSEWMSAADVLVTKAGPGTIAEALIRGLPIVLSGFLPGQEAPNVQYVTQTGAGAFSRQPDSIADIVHSWVSDRKELARRSAIARSLGRPHATYDIVREIATLCPQLSDRRVGTSTGGGGGGGGQPLAKEDDQDTSLFTEIWGNRTNHRGEHEHEDSLYRYDDGSSLSSQSDNN